METIIVPTPGTVLYRYCHSIWRDTPKPVYANWGYCLAILARVWTPLAHVYTLVRTHASSSYLGSKQAPRYQLPPT